MHGCGKPKVGASCALKINLPSAARAPALQTILALGNCARHSIRGCDSVLMLPHNYYCPSGRGKSLLGVGVAFTVARKLRDPPVAV
jgi:hypothetical protein